MRRALLVLLLGFAALACSGDDDEGSTDVAAFCASLEEAGTTGFLGDLDPTDPAAAEETVERLRQLQDQAPPDVEAEIEILADAAERLSTALADGEADIGEILEQVDDLEDVQEIQAAAERVADFAVEECGIEQGPDAS